MAVSIRAYRAEDLEPVVALSLRAWAPVFASLENVLGRELCARLHGDWHDHQAGAVRQALADDGLARGQLGAMRVWVAEVERVVAGFVAARQHHETGIGEVWMLAVEPGQQRAGIGTSLTEIATEWFRESGMKVAMVETGGDPGHAAARRTYERTGFRRLEVARFFKAL